jgi:hypothetical protein
MNYDIGEGAKVKYDWSFKKPMDKYLADTILEEYGFRDFENEDVPYKLSKITVKKLKNPDVRQALITMIPNLDTEELEEIAERNTQKEPHKAKAKAYSIGEDKEGITEGKKENNEIRELEAGGRREPEDDRMILVASSFEVEGQEDSSQTDDDSEGEEDEEIGESSENEEDEDGGDEEDEEGGEEEPVTEPLVGPVTSRAVDGSVAWNQGGKYKLISPPYGRANIRESSKPFAGLVAHDTAQSAYRALLKKHKGTLPPTIVRDMGMNSEVSVGGSGKTKTMGHAKGRRRGTSVERLSGL